MQQTALQELGSTLVWIPNGKAGSLEVLRPELPAKQPLILRAILLGLLLAMWVAFSLAAQVGREISPQSHTLAGNVGDIAGHLLVILAAF